MLRTDSGIADGRQTLATPVERNEGSLGALPSPARSLCGRRRRCRSLVSPACRTAFRRGRADNSAVAGPVTATSEASLAVPPPDGLSAFVSRVLDQLSLSSWLPASMLVGSGAVLLRVRAQERVDVGAAVTELTAQPLGILVVLLFALVIAAMVTQAFAFEVIRLLEGYWGHSRPGHLLTWAATSRHVRRLERLRRRHDELRVRVFSTARGRMLQDGRPRELVDVLEAHVLGQPVPTALQARVDEALGMGWRPSVPPHQLARLDDLAADITDYPEDHRVLPTRLGNVLRAAEDVLPDDGGDMEGHVLRTYDAAPPALREQHDQFRNRLDMYCTLVFVCTVLAAVGAASLGTGRPGVGPAGAAAGGFLVLAAVSYAAAVSSARGFGTVLRAMSQA